MYVCPCVYTCLKGKTCILVLYMHAYTICTYKFVCIHICFILKKLATASNIYIYTYTLAIYVYKNTYTIHIYTHTHGS